MMGYCLVWLWLWLSLLLVSSSRAFDFQWDNDVVKRYSKMKMLNDCLGESFLKSWRQSIVAASEKCHREPTDQAVPDLVTFFKSNKQFIREILSLDKDSRSPPYSPVESPSTHYFPPPSPIPSSSYPNLQARNNYLVFVPEKPASAQQQQGQLDVGYFKQVGPTEQLPGNQFNQVGPSEQLPGNQLTGDQSSPQPLWAFPISSQYEYSKPQTNIWKRSTRPNVQRRKFRDSKEVKPHSEDLFEQMFLTESIPKLEKLKRRMSVKISNITCVLKHMEIITDRGFPNYKQNTALLRKLDISEFLRDNLLESQDFCREFSMCVPTHRLSNPIMEELGYSFVFLKCMKKMVFQACMANDLFRSNFGASFGLDNYGSHSSLLDQLSFNEDNSPKDTIKDLEYFLEKENEIGFGF